MDEFKFTVDEVLNSLPCSEETLKSIARYIMLKDHPTKGPLLLAELFENLGDDWKPTPHPMLMMGLSFLNPRFKAHYVTLNSLFDEYQRTKSSESN
jgi:hypothetical protein